MCIDRQVHLVYKAGFRRTSPSGTSASGTSDFFFRSGTSSDVLVPSESNSWTSPSEPSEFFSNQTVLVRDVRGRPRPLNGRPRPIIFTPSISSRISYDSILGVKIDFFVKNSKKFQKYGLKTIPPSFPKTLITLMMFLGSDFIKIRKNYVQEISGKKSYGHFTK